MSSHYSAILLDLDGTIADSAPGITSTLAYTFEKMGRPIPSPAELLEWVGPPIMDSFRDLAGFDHDESQHALAIYRAQYIKLGAVDAEPFPGIGRVLRAIHTAGVPLSLATSKPELPATVILRHFGFEQYFDVITGASADEVRSAKADVVEEALRRLRLEGHDVSRPVLVGDRIFDVEGAAAHGIPTIAVNWGYGNDVEHAGAIAVVDTADELIRQLGLAEPQVA